MKELSIEEKAKAYDEAIEKFDVILNLNIVKESGTIFADDVRKIFPELKESEDDDEIRKDILNYIKHNYDGQHISISRYDSWIAWLERQCKPQIRTGLEWVNTIDDACDKRYSEEYAHGEYCHEQSFKWGFEEGVDWLEKQGEQKHTAEEVLIKAGLKPYKDGDQWCILLGDNIQEGICGFGSTIEDALYAFLKDLIASQSEQKPADKVEPKFRAGVWVVLTAGELSTTLQIVKVDTNKKLYWFNDNSYLPIVDEECLHLWTIEDAKNGDVLVCEDFGYTSLMLFKSFSNSRISLHCWYNSQTNNFHINTDVALRKDANIYPATKEQCDLLFQKMKEAGYEWDADKKELKKIVTPIFHIGNRIRYKGHACDGIITEITDTDYICGNAKLPISTQDKLELVEQNSALQSQSTWKPSDEQMEGLECTIKTLRYQLNAGDNRLDSLYNDLKKLREE